jgi:formylglycine-generating enzyme required for sulfatase activity
MDYTEKVALAGVFKGKQNSDWTPTFHIFELKGIQMEMCLVPPGSFLMGNDDYETQRPVHLQTLTEPYWISVHPITTAQWRIGVENSKSVIIAPEWVYWYNKDSKGDYPVVGVTWYQCVKFLEWLGTEWRLPTEMEWEYSARGPDNLVYSFGNDFQPHLVNYVPNSYNILATIGGRPKGASWVGAQDLSCFISEWTSSLYQSYPYYIDDGRENITLDAQRVLRGGAWSNSRSLARAAFRTSSYPSEHNWYTGFRCVRSV